MCTCVLMRVRVFSYVRMLPNFQLLAILSPSSNAYAQTHPQHRKATMAKMALLEAEERMARESKECEMLRTLLTKDVEYEEDETLFWDDSGSEEDESDFDEDEDEDEEMNRQIEDLSAEMQRIQDELRKGGSIQERKQHMQALKILQSRLQELFSRARSSGISTPLDGDVEDELMLDDSLSS